MMQAKRFILPPVPFLLTVSGIVLSIAFSILWCLESVDTWAYCYLSAIILGVSFLWMHRRNLISLNGIFVGISLIAITFPAVPYLLFGIEPLDSFNSSIYINSLGLIYFLSLANIISPRKTLYFPHSKMYIGPYWDKFVRINGLICIFTFPIVIIALTKAGAWGYLFGDRSGEYDRIASMKGLGPLMIFSVINVTSLFFWGCGRWISGKKIQVICIVIAVLFFNGFTGGRQNYIFFFLGASLIYLGKFGLKKSILFAIPVVGLAIVLMKIIRVSDISGLSDIPWYLGFFMQFVGDFDSLNNVSILLDYLRLHDFFGFYHIWSNFLIYIPREIYPDKPHDIGTLYLNTYLFPGVYLGADGGTSLVLGFQGLWYAIYGLPTMLLGNLILAISMAWADRKIYVQVHQTRPSLFLVAYIFLVGQSIITYRDGFYSYLNTFFYVAVYWIIYQFLNAIVRKNEFIGSSRTLASASGKELP